MTGVAETGELVGVLGGTFDPVHFGHLEAARQVATVFALRRVLLVPAATPPHKRHGPIASEQDRVAMLRMASADRPGLEVCLLEIERGGTSYTLDTLLELRARGLVPLFVVGADAMSEFVTWHRHDRLLREFDLVVVDRPGTSLDEVRHEAGAEVSGRIVAVPCVAGAGLRTGPPPAGSGGRVFHVPIPRIAVSSSAVRAVARSGGSLGGLVPSEVARYIQEHQIYRQGG